MINAPFFDKQPTDKFTEIFCLIGSQAWWALSYNKQEKRANGQEWLLLCQATGKDPKNLPLVIGKDQLNQVNQLNLTQSQTMIRFCQVGELSEMQKTALLQNIAQNSPLETVIFADNLGQTIEDVSDYIHRLRTDESTQQLAKMATDKIIANKNKSEWEKQADYLKAFEKLSPKERLIEFLEWGKYTFAFNPQQGNAIYTFTGIKWELLSDEMISRLINEFFISKGYLKFGDAQLKNVMKCIPSSSEFVPLMMPTNPELLPFKNGVLNKRTGEFSPHSQENYLTSFINVDYSSERQITPNFNKWLDFVSENNPNKRMRILSALYFVLTNRYEWQLFLEIIGEGGSGKSTFTAIAELLAGKENTASTSLKNLENPTLRCSLLNKTLVICPDQKKYIGEGEELKSITGQDIISFNPKYKDPFDDRVRAVFIITGNEPMIFTENNGGVDRRRIIFKFDNVVPKEKRDYYLINKIQDELNGIINLLLETFKNPITALNLLEEQKESKEAMQVKEETDHLLDFLNAFHTKEEAFARGLFLGRPKQVNINHSFKEYLLSAYDLYCKINDINKPISKNRFKGAIERASKKKRMHPPLKISKIDGKNRTNFYFNNPEEIENEWLNN
ncbi:hypothetical protein A1D25_01810 [Ursidibacter arcticus]|uniref:DNA primase family protein n=1 Tax=Ursidibacter arcticus TaxID=1524965 RepID=UPI0012FCA0D3|nr:phage/plasmid primase, P4 family [Ursidibacter arcticus]KAE9531852.1 hypothetical protein A1D25_01810 [Ursidibacter arcticus]